MCGPIPLVGLRLTTSRVLALRPTTLLSNRISLVRCCWSSSYRNIESRSYLLQFPTSPKTCCYWSLLWTLQAMRQRRLLTGAL